VKAVFDGAGREERRIAPRAVRQVIAPETARTLTRMLAQVVDGGTGKRAAIPGYAVAGKTGTAQKLDPNTRRYSRAPGVLSFVGFAPAEDPRFAMLVMLDEPKNEKWGSEAAAPIFSAIGREVLRYLEVAPHDTPPVQIVTRPGESLGSPVRLVGTAIGEPDVPGQTMPDVRGQSLRQALRTLSALGMDVRVHGRGRVTDQQPAPGAEVEPGAAAVLALGAADARR
jgi:cell division protein FtsI (penicillin-binding protein 3)